MRSKKQIVEALAAHADSLVAGTTAAPPPVVLTAEEQAQVAPLMQLAVQLHRQMQPVHPSAAFVQSLGRELVANARQQVSFSRRLRRATLIGAAAVGSLLSIASVIGAIVFVVVRRRTRAQMATA